MVVTATARSLIMIVFLKIAAPETKPEKAAKNAARKPAKAKKAKASKKAAKPKKAASKAAKHVHDSGAPFYLPHANGTRRYVTSSGSRYLQANQRARRCAGRDTSRHSFLQPRGFISLRPRR